MYDLPNVEFLRREWFFWMYDKYLNDKVYPLQLNIILGEYLKPLKNRGNKNYFKNSFIKNFE